MMSARKTKKRLGQGDQARYVGTRHRYLRGYKVLIGKPILDGGSATAMSVRDHHQDGDQPASAHAEEPQSKGGLDRGEPTGYYEVYPWLKEKGRWSFVSSDVALDELEPWVEDEDE